MAVTEFARFRTGLPWKRSAGPGLCCEFMQMWRQSGIDFFQTHSHAALLAPGFARAGAIGRRPSDLSSLIWTRSASAREESEC